MAGRATALVLITCSLLNGAFCRSEPLVDVYQPETLDLAWWLRRSERRVYSQNGEDGLLDALIDAVASASRTSVPPVFVEFGVQDGSECNTRYLKELRNWTGFLMDGSNENSSINLHKRYITAENINGVLGELEASATLGVLSVDLDFSDWHVWRSILEAGRHRAVIVIVEYNSSIDPEHALVVPYQPAGVWDGSHFYGASLLALDRLGRKHGYALVACDSSGTNAFFVDTKWAGWAQQGEGRNMTTRLSALGPLPTLHSAFVRAAYVGEYTKNSAEHDAQLSLTINVGGGESNPKLLTASCPLSPALAASGHARSEIRSRLTSCAHDFAVQHNLRGGTGCDETSNEVENLECVTSVLANAFLQRRWLNVNEEGDVLELVLESK